MRNKSFQKDSMWNKVLGRKGESVAMSFYLKRGWELIRHNEQTRNTELDLIFTKSFLKDRIVMQEILFVEVKTVIAENRAGLTPEDNFTKQKQKHFKRGIEKFLAKCTEKNRMPDKIRIDLACVYHHTIINQWTIKVYENIILE